MAGNIIPAIASTNAITAGIAVMRAFSVLQEQYDRCQSVYVRLRLNPRNQIFVPDRSKFIRILYYNSIQTHRNLFFLLFFFRQRSANETKSKVHRLFGEAKGCNRNRYQTRHGQTIP